MKKYSHWLIGMILAGGIQAQEEAPKNQEESKSGAVPKFAPTDGEMVNGGDVDPFAAPDAGGSSIQQISMARLGEKRETLQVRVEVWEVGTRDLAVAMDGFNGPLAIEGWRRERLKDEKSRLVHAPVVVLEEKSAGATESIVEEIYPTEYEPPGMLPDKVVEQMVAEKVPESLNEWISMVTSSAVATSFETRNTGFTLSATIQPVTSEADCWDVSLEVEDVNLVRMKTFEPEALNIMMPVFSKFGTGGLHRVAESRWQLISAVARPKGEETQVGNLSWVTLVRIDPAR
jgi:hypothetical protein